MSQAYSDPKRADDPYALPDVETFYVNEDQARAARREPDHEVNGSATEAGWYYWFCFPGCLPDTDPIGPFASEDEAIADAQEGSADE